MVHRHICENPRTNNPTRDKQCNRNEQQSIRVETNNKQAASQQQRIALNNNEQQRTATVTVTALARVIATWMPMHTRSHV